MKKMIFTVLAVLTIFSTCVMKNALAYETVYEKSSLERISSGVILKEDTYFGDKGWLSFHIAEVDLTDKNTHIGLLTSENGLNTFQTVLQMANASNQNVVTAVNGDFFNGNSKNGNTIGLSVSDGEIYTSTYYENEVKDTFGTFALDKKNNGIFGYFSNKITLKLKGSEIELPIAEINKVSSDYSYPVLYTSKWGEKSVASKYDFPMTEMLVKNNKIVEIRNGGESFDIPQNGFVVSCYGSAAEYVNQNFKAKKKVELEVEMELDYSKIAMAISGGAMLVEEGKIPETFASNINGANPRTAIGMSQDGKTLYLVTVDGRQEKSVGLTQTEFAEFLVKKGIYNALNLDGGGSTTMVAKKLGEENLETINIPSGGTSRMVTNAVGVYTTAKSSSTLAGLILKVPEENVFVGSQRKIEILGYNKYDNPVKVNENKIKWSYGGVPVQVKDGIIYAGEEAGTATITAKIGRVEASISVDVLSMPNEIEISPKYSNIVLGDSVSYETKIKNKNGYVASMSKEELSFAVVSGDGKWEGNQFTPNKEGEHIISVSVGNAVSYAKVLVKTGEETEALPDDIKGEDASQKESKLTKEESLKILVYDGKKEKQTLLDVYTQSKIEQKAKEEADITLWMEEKPYGVEDIENATVITVDISKGGIRATDYKEWIYLQDDIKNSKQKNIFIVMNGSLSDFSDTLEKQLFIDVLCDLRRSTSKNIWVIEKGEKTTYSMERGVRYLSINNKMINTEEPINVVRSQKYIMITATQDEISYEIKKVFE